MEWARDFNYDRFKTFYFEGGDHLDLSRGLEPAFERLKAADWLLSDAAREVSIDADVRWEAFRARSCIRESTEAVHWATEEFIRQLRIPSPDSLDRIRGLYQRYHKQPDPYDPVRQWPKDFPARLDAVVKMNLLDQPAALHMLNGVRNDVVHGLVHRDLASAAT